MTLSVIPLWYHPSKTKDDAGCSHVKDSMALSKSESISKADCPEKIDSRGVRRARGEDHED